MCEACTGWGDFWPTASRRELTTFTGEIYNDFFHVIVDQDIKSNTFGESLKQPFDPFTARLWVFTFAVLGVVGVTLTLMHRTGKLSFWAELPELAQNFIKGWHGFGSGEIKQVVIGSTGGWLTQFAVGFTKTVLVAGYTSMQVATLVQQTSTQVTSFKEAKDRGYRFCANDQIAIVIGNQYPGTKMVPVPYLEILQRMDAGECDAAIIDDNQWRDYRSNGQTHYCDTKVRLPDVVVTVPNTIVVTEALTQALSWAVRADVEAGRYPSLSSRRRSVTTPPASAGRPSPPGGSLSSTSVTSAGR